ncbi:hypothetical protein ACFSQP_06355 [Bizionia sediminis]|uniref:Uncharacterized protein n=1 Tax=Bizionia sediminis TaxID=1737064 RepID=A0ABW5KU49_9FLAO
MSTDYTQLLMDVQKRANIIVSSNRDVRLLKEAIDFSLDKSIGLNTLRRMFGYLERTTPSISSLNTLARYIGYDSYARYKINKSNHDQWYFQQSLQRIFLSKTVKKEDISIINQGLMNESNSVFFAYFLTFQIGTNNLEALDFIFQHVKMDAIKNTELHKFANIVSVKLNNTSEKKALKIYKTLIHYSSFRDNVPLLYVDYANLNSRYLKILNLIEAHGASSTDILFVSYMKLYLKFYSEQPITNIKLKKPDGLNNLFPVLQGRYYACCIMQSKTLTPTLIAEIFEACRTLEVRYFLQEIIPTLIVKEAYTLLSELINTYYEDIFETDMWGSATINSLYLIGLANANWFENELKLAKKNLALVELQKVQLSYAYYVDLFFYLTQLKITYSEKNNLENAVYLKKIKQAVKKTGFTKFISESTKFILK